MFLMLIVGIFFCHSRFAVALGAAADGWDVAEAPPAPLLEAGPPPAAS